MPKKKQYKNYQEYLDSPEWRSLKKEFYHSYDGFDNVCQITGTEILKEDFTSDTYMCLHHWRYPKNWIDGLPDDLILVTNEIHDWLHNESDQYCDFNNDVDTKQKYICEAISGYMVYREECHSVELFKKREREKELFDTISSLRENCKKTIDRKDNHIDLLMEKLNG